MAFYVAPIIDIVDVASFRDMRDYMILKERLVSHNPEIACDTLSLGWNSASRNC